MFRCAQLAYALTINVCGMVKGFIVAIIAVFPSVSFVDEYASRVSVKTFVPLQFRDSTLVSNNYPSQTRSNERCLPVELLFPAKLSRSRRAAAIRCIILHLICMADDTDKEVTVGLEIPLSFYAYEMTRAGRQVTRIRPLQSFNFLICGLNKPHC